MGALRQMFDDLCPETTYSGMLYHGTQLSGAIDIVGAGGFDTRCTEGGHHTGLPLVSTSQNDNVLTLFGDNAGTGFVFLVKEDAPLRIRKLHDFFHALATAYESSVDLLADMFESDSKWEFAAVHIGAATLDGQIHGLSPDTFMELAGEIDGFVFPGFDSQHPRAEAELGLTQRGCQRIWPMLDGILLDGEEFSSEDGLKKLGEMHCEEEAVRLAGRSDTREKIESRGIGIS